MRSILEVKAGEAFMSQIMKGCGGHAEEFGVYLEDSGATKGLLARERERIKFLLEKDHTLGSRLVVQGKRVFLLGRMGLEGSIVKARTGNWSLAASCLPLSSLSFLPMTSPNT